MARGDENNVTIEDARLVYKNFAGKEGLYNRAGDRNFAVVLDDDAAEMLRRDKWNVKSKPGREEGDGEFHTLAVAVSFKGRPPRLIMLTSRGRTILDESTCAMLDYADIKTVDLIIRPYDYEVNNTKGRKAYLKTIYVTINEDELELKYADVRDAGDTGPSEPDYDAVPEL